MLTSKQISELEKTIIGKPVADIEMCFYMKASERYKAITEQLCLRLSQLYGYALIENVSQATSKTGKDGILEPKYEELMRIRVITNTQQWDRLMPSLSWIIHGILNIYGLSHMDMTIEGTLYQAHL